MNKVTRAWGTKLSKGTDTPVVIGGLTHIGGIEITAEPTDVTALDSDDDYRKYIVGFKDGGEVAVEGYFDPSEDSGQVALQDSLNAGTAEDYKITFPTTPKAEWAFKGVITAFRVGDVDTDGTIGFGATIKVSGKPELTIEEET